MRSMAVKTFMAAVLLAVLALAPASGERMQLLRGHNHIKPNFVRNWLDFVRGCRASCLMLEQVSNQSTLVTTEQLACKFRADYLQDCVDCGLSTVF